MLYQATRQFGDYDNGIEIPLGAYVDTDCVKWVQRIGPFLRLLPNGETPKASAKIFTVKNTIEDAIVEVPVVESIVEDFVETEEEATSEDAAEVVTRRKIKPTLRRSKED